MSVSRICTRIVAMATPVESVRAVARRMGEYNVGTVVVVDETRHPVGILTDRDIALRCVAPGESADALSVARIMTTPVRTVPEGAPIEEAVATMKRDTRRYAKRQWTWFLREPGVTWVETASGHAGGALAEIKKIVESTRLFDYAD